MGNNLCGPDQIEPEINIFDYRFGEDHKEINIKHTDRLLSPFETIRPYLEDCETKLKRSEKRFKDIALSSQPLKLACEGKEIHCHFERPEAFLKRNSKLRERMYTILDRNSCRPSNVIVGDDVMQYFGVFLCYLADNPELISRIIITEENSYGVAAVLVVWEGKREVLFIDDYILCNKDGPLFSKPVNYTDMWPCLLEKAWFKLKASFKSKIDRVHPIEVFKKFLMFPLKTHVLGDSLESSRRTIKEELTDPLAQGLNLGCVVTSKSKPQHIIGISGRRNFYLIKVFRMEGQTYFYMRNPCGQFDFRGRMKEVPSTIEQHISKMTKDTLIPGNFLLTEQQFEEQIESFFTIVFSPHSSVVSQQTVNFYSSETPEVYVKFQLKRPCPVSLRLQQMGKLGFAPVTFLVMDAEKGNLVSGDKNDEGCFGVEQTNLLKGEYQDLAAGNYIMRLKKKPEGKQDNSYQWLAETTFKSKDMLIATAQEGLQFEASSSKEFKEEFENGLKRYAKRELSASKDARRDEIEHLVVWLGDLVVIYINKLNSAKDMMNLEMQFPELTNLECTSHKVGKGYSSLPAFKQDSLIVFEKVRLTEQTSLGNYSLSPY